MSLWDDVKECWPDWMPLIGGVALLGLVWLLTGHL